MGNGRRDAGARGGALRSGMVATCVAMAMAAVRTRLHRVRVRLRAEFRCRNAGEGAYEVAVHGDGLALQSRGAAFDDPTSSTLAFEPGRPAGGYVVVEVPLNRDAWRQRLIGRGFDDEAALEVLREALRLLGEGRVVPSRPGAPDAVYAPDLPAALRGSADEPPLSDALDAGSRRLVVSLRRLS